MRNFIVTTIIALAAAKAKSHTRDKLDGQKRKKKKGFKKQLEGTRDATNFRIDYRINI